MYTPREKGAELPFTSLTSERDEYGRLKEDLLNKDFEEEVIYRDDFFKTVLTDLGLKKYTDVPEETAKLENCLTLIGAISADT